MIDSSQPPYFKDVKLVQGYQITRVFPRLVTSKNVGPDDKIFISPYIDREGQCRDCQTPIDPHIYKVGGLVVASCFHGTRSLADEPGGIHFQFESDCTSLNHGRTGWRVIVEPIGQMAWWGYEADGCRAAPDVLVKEMVAFCHSDNPYRVDTNPKRLTEGYLLASHLDGIVPVCRPEHKHYSREIVMGQFRIENGVPILS